MDQLYALKENSILSVSSSVANISGIAVEVFDEVDQNLEDFIDKDGLLIDKDIMSKGNDGHND